MAIAVRPDGPMSARIMIVGEAPGKDEEEQGVPFVGQSGQELNRILHEAGIMRSECFVTNVARVRPDNNYIGHFIALKKKDVGPQHSPLRDKYVTREIQDGFRLLQEEIATVKPNVVVACGNVPMWALTGHWGITKWRGSLLRADGQGDLGPKVIPTYHPAAILRQWDWRAVSLADFRRVRAHSQDRNYSFPQWHFTLRPNFLQVVDRLQWLEQQLTDGAFEWLDFDIETRAGHIATAGISWSQTDAISIPFMCVENWDGYWNEQEEAQIILLLYRVLCHRKARIRWQNGLYDAQYTWRHWHFIPGQATREKGRHQDTMISQHTMFGDLPKSLAFQASMYDPHYVYWKDDGKTWSHAMGEDQLWSYNCEDCIRTRVVGEVEQQTLDEFTALSWPDAQPVHDFQQKLFWPVLRAMTRGLKVIESESKRLASILTEEIQLREEWLYKVLGHAINISSPKQMQELFYGDFAQKPIMKKQLIEGVMVWRPTVNDDALNQIGTREPLLRPVCVCIQDMRTLGKWLNDFILAKRDTDGRMRCSFNIGGSASGESAPRTYRLSSSKDAFESGANLQTIPSEKSKSVGKAVARGMKLTALLDEEGRGSGLPNIRAMFGPDAGYTFFDGDLDRSDLQTVVWETGEKDFKAAISMGVDLHLWNAYIIDNRSAPPLDELVETHPKYKDHRVPMKYKREFAKVFCHGTNFGGKPPTMAKHCGITVHAADRAQRIWFGAHPGIQRWHLRVEEQIKRFHYIENQFGYRWYIFDRVEGMLPEAIAWVPQSHSACVINRIWMNFYEQLPEVEVLLQVHDSLAGQFPTHLKDRLLPKMQVASRIVIPYEDPLVIPFGLKLSEHSWGDC